VEVVVPYSKVEVAAQAVSVLEQDFRSQPERITQSPLAVVAPLVLEPTKKIMRQQVPIQYLALLHPMVAAVVALMIPLANLAVLAAVVVVTLLPKESGVQEIRHLHLPHKEIMAATEQHLEAQIIALRVVVAALRQLEEMQPHRLQEVAAQERHRQFPVRP
jgi:hypothetical protein